MENENWKTIKEYPDYEVSNFGKIKSFKKYSKTSERVLKLKKDKYGYFNCCLSINKKHTSKKIHTLVYETFYNDKIKSNECIHHKDENKENNYYENLEKILKSDHNIFHKKEENKGESNGRHKLSNQDIYDIRKSLELKLYIPKQLSWMFDIDLSVIYDIKNKKLWMSI